MSVCGAKPDGRISAVELALLGSQEAVWNLVQRPRQRVTRAIVVGTLGIGLKKGKDFGGEHVSKVMTLNLRKRFLRGEI